MRTIIICCNYEHTYVHIPLFPIFSQTYITQSTVRYCRTGDHGGFLKMLLVLFMTHTCPTITNVPANNHLEPTLGLPGSTIRHNSGTGIPKRGRARGARGNYNQVAFSANQYALV